MRCDLASIESFERIHFDLPLPLGSSVDLPSSRLILVRSGSSGQFDQVPFFFNSSSSSVNKPLSDRDSAAILRTPCTGYRHRFFRSIDLR